MITLFCSLRLLTMASGEAARSEHPEAYRFCMSREQSD